MAVGNFARDNETSTKRKSISSILQGEEEERWVVLNKKLSFNIVSVPVFTFSIDPIEMRR